MSTRWADARDANEYGASYALSAGRLSLSGLNYTQMRCFAPPVMIQEARYLEAFTRVTICRLDPSGLTLSDATGAYALRFA
ncbi:MAG TPA: META domain-containing protein [Ktedonobacterales bacterium]